MPRRADYRGLIAWHSTSNFKGLRRHKWLRGVKITVGVNNVFNKMPPEAPDDFPSTNADIGTYDGAIGRMFYLTGKYSY